ncbi:hypothetical protein [Pedobacter sp. SYSU D00535]|uniref:hypothetical protein n=1 Tax=Pedobacter sp. SYSU D00535 TaxID=2810308 RepID=UPI001A95961C|nr:hypothetical protein [Pedobacter sp. SYSU D00535]
MDKLLIPINRDDEVFEFEVVDYVHDETHRCKFEVTLGNELVASFEPDRHGHLHLCNNFGKIDKQILHLLAEKIEAYNL